MRTDIEKLENEQKEEKEGDDKKVEEIAPESLSTTIFDFSNPLELRLSCMQRYYDINKKDGTLELITKLCTMYEVSGTKSLKEFLYQMTKLKIEPFLKALCCLSLHSKDNFDELAYQAINEVYPELTESTAYKMDFLKILFRSEKFKEFAKNHFCDIMNDSKISAPYRYKMLLSLEMKPMDGETVKEVKQREFLGKKYAYFLKEGQKTFARKTDNDLRYRILSCQYLFSTELTEEEKRELEQILLSFAEDASIEYNARADSADVILQYGGAESKERAKRVILTLGRGERRSVNIYDNAQNVHIKSIEESLKKALEFLNTIELAKVNSRFITLDYVEGKIYEYMNERNVGVEKEEKIRASMNRIAMDRSLYNNCSLELILLKVWTYICNHEHRETMKQRLLEELVEMAGTCSSGYASRLINTMSGFGDFSMSISWRDQIIANVSGRLNARIRDLDDLELQERIMTELSNAEYIDKKNFTKFFRENIALIQEEMYEEFKSHISDQEFEMHFRSAISNYETGSFV